MIENQFNVCDTEGSVNPPKNMPLPKTLSLVWQKGSAASSSSCGDQIELPVAVITHFELLFRVECLEKLWKLFICWDFFVKHTFWVYFCVGNDTSNTWIFWITFAGTTAYKTLKFEKKHPLGAKFEKILKNSRAMKTSEASCFEIIFPLLLQIWLTTWYLLQRAERL